MNYRELAEAFLAEHPQPPTNYKGKIGPDDNITFLSVPVGVFKKYADEHPELFNLSEQHNFAPCVRDFLRLGEPDDILECYIVHSSRGDKRVEIDGIQVKAEAKEQIKKILAACGKSRSGTPLGPDEFDPSDEYLGRVRLWWD